MHSEDIRKKFLNYFKEKEHALVPSAPTVPMEDPTLLFNNAGMNQFKDVFLGKAVREYKRATTAQKCIRVGGKHNDLDNVGHTSRHMTFFEMLGNFSFGDYFKKEAIFYSWDVATNVFGFDPSRIWITIFETDDEAFELWKAHIDETRIIRLGEKDNFWSMGATGPCGPCSELHYDRGPLFGTASSPMEDKKGERFGEFWNLVFMQYNRDESGKMTPLPKPCVDTGAGLERIMAFLKGFKTVFQTDILAALIKSVENISGMRYEPNDNPLAPAFHVIADHLRALAFAIADGAEPSNTERGYVLRKILRRALRYGRRLDLNRPFLAKLLPTLIDRMGSDFHELKTASNRIEELLTLEEESFIKTLQRGGNILNAIIEKAKNHELKQISGEQAFKLKDTYGFPLEEILLIAKDSNLSVNLDMFQILEKEAKEKSRKAQGSALQKIEQNSFEDFTKHHGLSEFVGYDLHKKECSITGLFIDGKLEEKMVKGQEGMIILDKTPFYGEKGGQVGDSGTLFHKSATFSVSDTKIPFEGVIAHIGTLNEGALIMGEPVTAEIDRARRSEIEKHHSATHLLHFALQKVLGPHIIQAGSFLDENRLRFDFNHHKQVTKDEIRAIETLINEKIWDNSAVLTETKTLEEVQKIPEIKKFFGEKYGKEVRVVELGHFSKELCGGTHVKHLGTIGLFRIVKEGSQAKGVRRIEAVLGRQAEKLRYQSEDNLEEMATLLKTSPHKFEKALTSVLKENEHLKEQALFQRQKELVKLGETLLKNVKTIGSLSFLSGVVDVSSKELLELSNELVEKIGSGVITLSTSEGSSCKLLVRVSDDLIAKGVYANEIIRKVAALIGGSGGGKKASAQAGGKNSKGVIIAFETIEHLLEKQEGKKQ